MDDILLAMFGAAAVLAVFAIVWVPLRAQEALMRRRLAVFVELTTAPVIVPGEFTGRARRRRAAVTTAKRGPFMTAVDARITRARMDVRAEELLLGTAVATVLAALIAGVLWETVGGLLGAALVPLAVLAYLARRAATIQKKFSEQLADSVAMLATSVRTGSSVAQAFEHVSRDAPEPTRAAFALAVREIGLGASLEQALQRIVETYPSEDMDLIATSINIHSSIGGSLAKILDTAAETIRERMRIAAEVRALTSQQRYSAYVLALLPLFILIALHFISPDYIDELFKPVLRIALVAAAVLVITGFLIMKRMADIDA